MFNPLRHFDTEKNCYIGSHSAAYYWGLTNKAEEKITLICSSNCKTYAKTLLQHSILRHAPLSEFYSIQVANDDGYQICISSPEKTILDLIDLQEATTLSTLANSYLKKYFQLYSSDGLQRLIDLLDECSVGAKYKRIGFLLEHLGGVPTWAVEHCQRRISRGNSYLAHSDVGVRLSSRWHLWVPKDFS